MKRFPALAMCLLLVACGQASDTPNGNAEVEPRTEPAASHAYGCSGGTFTERAIEAQEEPSQDLLEALNELRQTMDGAMLPESGWIEVTRTDTRSTVLAPLGDAYASATFEKSDGSWKPRGWGECTPRLQISKKSVLRWAFAGSDYPPDPGAREIELLVTEVNCSSGRDIEGLIEPTISYHAEVVEVLLMAPQLAGAQNCVGTKPTRYEIVLTEPIGDRDVVDPSVYPIVEPTPGTRLP